MEADRLDRLILWLTSRIWGHDIDRVAREAVEAERGAPVRRSRRQALAVLQSLAREPGPVVSLGQTAWETPVPVDLPLAHLVKAHAIITGGTGAGKTMAALAVIDALLAGGAPDCSFGVVDAKGELFERTLYLIVRRLEALPRAQAETLARRLVIVDLAARDPVTSYNIAAPWTGSDLDFFSASRVETLEELLGAGNGFSLRGAAIAQHVLKLLALRRLPFSYFDRVLASEPFRAKLLAGVRQTDLGYYFEKHFPNEGRAAIAAVRTRIASALFSSESLKLALAGEGAPDLRRHQDAGDIVLINCAGPNIPRPTARTLQALFLSDIRQAVFARASQRPYLWVCDEAQNFFRTRHLRENMTDLLTMSRSFGAFFLYLTQNLATAVQEGEMLETLHTNIRWSLTLRTTPRDGVFLKSAFPVTGCREKPRLHAGEPRRCFSITEERSLLAEELAHLPDRTGWLWLKSQSPEAVQIRTRTIRIPEGPEFEDRVAWIRSQAAIGRRAPYADHAAAIARRDAEWLADEQASTAEDLRNQFRRDQDAAGGR